MDNFEDLDDVLDEMEFDEDDDLEDFVEEELDEEDFDSLNE